MIYPNKLRENDVIEIISPSNGVKSKKREKYERALNKLMNFGFSVIEDQYVRNSVNGASSTAENRAIEFNRAINNHQVKALIACSGGDYIIQILDLIKYKDILDHIKWIQGHSDITALLFYITTKYDIATIYSFNANTFGDNHLPHSMLANDIEFIKGFCPTQIEYDVMNGDQKKIKSWECVTKYRPMKGRIIGGCLDSLKDIIGTKYDVVKAFIKKYKEDGIVWYFDVANMSNEDILRTLWQFNNAGWFKKCKGILFGRLENEISYTDISLTDAIQSILRNLNVPILINVDIGHTNPVFTIINGSIVKIEKKDKYTLETYLI